jgi:DNA primase
MQSAYDLENEFYKKALNHAMAGEPGKRYLQTRGINEETIKKWEIGYCPIGHKKYKKLKGRIVFLHGIKTSL